MLASCLGTGIAAKSYAPIAWTFSLACGGHDIIGVCGIPIEWCIKTFVKDLSNKSSTHVSNYAAANCR